MVLVSHRFEFICLKTHKTASTSIESGLERFCAPADAPPESVHRRPAAFSEAGIIGARGPRFSRSHLVWRDHASALRVRLALGQARWRRYLKITSVRNPYARAVSAFFSEQPRGARRQLAEASFDETRAAFRRWVRTADLRRNLDKIVLFGDCCIDYFVYYETLAESLDELAGRLGLDAPVTLRRFKSGRNTRPEPYQDYYDAATRALVARASAFEIAFFGYDFNAGPDPALRTALPVSLAPRDLVLARITRRRAPNPPPGRAAALPVAANDGPPVRASSAARPGSRRGGPGRPHAPGDRMRTVPGDQRSDSK